MVTAAQYTVRRRGASVGLRGGAPDAIMRAHDPRQGSERVYLLWKYLHVGTVYLSLAGFVLRGIWMLLDSPLRQTKPARILPHVVDTLLLAAAIGLMLTIGQYPFVHGWLTAKVLALVAYIGLGMVAFRFGRTRGVRGAAFFAALVAFAYMLSVAYAHDPFPFA